MSHRTTRNTCMKALLVWLLTIVTMVLSHSLSQAARAQDYRTFSRYSPGDLAPGNDLEGLHRDFAMPSGQSLGELLRPDGTADFKPGFRGTLDARGYRLASPSDETPRFQAASVSGDERWSEAFGPRGFDNGVDALVLTGAATSMPQGILPVQKALRRTT